MLTSRQRILNAIDRQPVDHTPLMLRFWWLGGEQDNIPFDWRDELRRVQATLTLGLDDTLLLEPPLGYVEHYHPEQLSGVHSYVERLPPPEGERTPLLRKIYETPAGPLQTTIRLTEDWPFGDEIRLFDDYNIPRLVEPLIKTSADLPALRCLLTDPTLEQIQAFNQCATELRQQSQRLGVVLDGGWVALGDAVMWLCGMQRILYGQMDEPEFIDQVLQTVFEWESRRVDLLLEQSIDVLVHMAWYENTDFWTPANYRRLLRPRLQHIIDKAHAHGARFRYIMTKSWQPYLEDFIQMGIDCLTGVDPVQDRLDLAQVRRRVGGRLCLMGGVNSAVMLSEWTAAEIRQAVDQAMTTLAPGGGFILYPVDAVFNSQPWEKVLTLIERWKVTCAESGNV